MVGGRGRTHEKYAVTFRINQYISMDSNCQCDVTAVCGIIFVVLLRKLDNA